MANSDRQSEPSMEELIASIREIIAEEPQIKKPSPPSKPEEKPQPETPPSADLSELLEDPSHPSKETGVLQDEKPLHKPTPQKDNSIALVSNQPFGANTKFSDAKLPESSLVSKSEPTTSAALQTQAQVDQPKQDENKVSLSTEAEMLSPAAQIPEQPLTPEDVPFAARLKEDELSSGLSWFGSTPSNEDDKANQSVAQETLPSKAEQKNTEPSDVLEQDAETKSNIIPDELSAQQKSSAIIHSFPDQSSGLERLAQQPDQEKKPAGPLFDESSPLAEEPAKPDEDTLASQKDAASNDTSSATQTSKLLQDNTPIEPLAPDAELVSALSTTNDLPDAPMQEIKPLPHEYPILSAAEEVPSDAQATNETADDSNLAISGTSDLEKVEGASDEASSSAASQDPKDEQVTVLETPDIKPDASLSQEPEEQSSGSTPNSAPVVGSPPQVAEETESTDAPKTSVDDAQLTSPAIETALSDLLRPIVHQWLQDNMPKLLKTAFEQSRLEDKAKSE